MRSYSSSQFEKSSTNSNSNYIKLPKINLLINNHVCLMWGGGGGQITFLSFLFFYFLFFKFPQQLLLHLIDLHSNNSYSKIMVEMKRKKKGVISIGSDLALILPTVTVTVKRAFSVMNIIECEING